MYKHFKAGTLTLEAKVWYSLVTSQLGLDTHTSDITLERVKLVYAIMRGVPIDFGRLIYSKIIDYYH